MPSAMTHDSFYTASRLQCTPRMRMSQPPQPFLHGHYPSRLITKAAVPAAVSAHLHPGLWVSACVHKLCLWAAGVHWRTVFPSAKRHGLLFCSPSCLHRNAIFALLLPLASGSPLEGHQGCFESWKLPFSHCKGCRLCLLNYIQLASSVGELGRLA